MMKGKITRSLSGSTGRTCGILIAPCVEASFGSVIEFSHYRLQWLFPYITFVRRESPETADANSDLHGKRGWRRRPPPATCPRCGTTPLLPPTCRYRIRRTSSGRIDRPCETRRLRPALESRYRRSLRRSAEIKNRTAEAGA